MNREEAVTKLAAELERRAKLLEEDVKRRLGDKGEVVMTPTNYTLEAQRMLDNTIVELAYMDSMRRIMFGTAPALSPIPPAPSIGSHSV